MKKFVLAMILSAAAWAQQGQTGPAPLGPGETLRVIEVKRGDALSIQRTLNAVFPGISVNNRMLIVRGQPAVVEMIEAAVAKLDVPPAESMPATNIEITAYLLYGSAQETAGSSAAIPADLEGTVRQLKTLFPYKNYKMLDTVILRGREGREMQYEGVLPGGQNRFSIYVSRPSVTSGPAPRTISMQDLRLSGYGNSQIHTSLDAKEGQKTVVGKANIVNSEDAIILVVSPKVIQ